MKSKFVVRNLTVLAMLACAHPVLALEGKPQFVSIVPNHLSTSTFHDQLQPEPRNTGSVETATRSVAFVETVSVAPSVTGKWLYTPPVAEAKKWALFGVGLTLLGMFARRSTLTRT